MSRSLASVASALLFLLLLSSGAAAQRKGFIIGGGLGPGVRFGDVSTEIGGTTDFRIGAMIGQSVQLYYRNMATFTDSERGYDFEASGLGGLGLTYQMPSPLRINGLIGLATIAGFSGDVSTDTGFGAGAGVGYEFAKYWVLNLDGSWGLFGGDNHVFTAAVTINVLSY